MRATPSSNQYVAEVARSTSQSRELRWLLLREVGLVAIGLSAIALLAFGPHIHHGGFYSDDWANAADYRFDEQIQAGLGLRYLLLLLLPVPHAVFGLDASDHLLLASALAVSSAGAFYAVLRLLRFGRIHAFAMSTLVLVFPGADSLRLWATAGVNSLSVTLFLTGLAIALRASRRAGRRAGCSISEHSCSTSAHC